MTREEAIEVLENGRWWDSLIPVTTIEGRIEDNKLHEALDLAIAALRPVSREQVEKVWRAHWNESVHLGGFVYCSRCGYNALEANNYTFCPKCGRPFTDEAVDMVMEKINNMEEMTNEH